jgi:hypothetical protein
LGNILSTMKSMHTLLRRVERCAVALLFLLITCLHALAWGRQGHIVVAEIAEQYLEISTVRQVREFLAVQNATTLADVSIWADQIRLQRPETGPWHYVNIPAHPVLGTLASYDRERDCPRGDCVVAKIEEFTRVLGDLNVSSYDRLEALKFLVHFVADIHQPLHASNKADRGGNDVRVEFDGRRTNLHAIWDTGILATAVQYGDERRYALELARQMNEGGTAPSRHSSPSDWANESYRIAADVIYKKLPNDGILPSSYAADMLPIVQDRLQRAGVRLADLLNKTLLLAQTGN